MLPVDDILDESHEQTVRPPRSGVSPYLTMVAAGFLTVLMVVTAGLTIYHLQQRVEEGTKANLAQLALVISEETSRSFQAVDVALTDTLEDLGVDRLARDEVETVFRREKTHRYLVDKLPAMPL